MTTPALRRLARAKVNLNLHVTGQRADGKHLLDSLVVFPEIGDLIEAAPARGLSLAIDGAFGQGLDAGAENLAIRAATALQGWARNAGAPEQGAALRLTKSLPIASGIGGGSTDAAATLSLLARLWDVEIDAAGLARIGLAIGADVPVCLQAPRPTRMTGIGEALAPAPALPDFWLVLVNPGVAVATGEVFARLAEKRNPPPPAPAPALSYAALLDWLCETRNDLETPARVLAPAIGDALDALAATTGCRLARMSGSGATCFGLFEREQAALDAAERIRLARPGWWTVAAPVSGCRPS